MQKTGFTSIAPTEQEMLELRQKAEQLSLAQDTVGIVTWLWDIANDRMQWFGDIAPLLGLAPGTFSGGFHDYLAQVHPEDREQAKQAFAECFKGVRPHYRTEERIRLADGGTRWLETYGRGFYASTGKAVRMTGVLSDITYRKAQEEALAMSEEKFFKAYHATPDGIALTRLEDGMIVEINAAFSRITGHSASEALGRTTTALGIWTDDNQRTEALRQLRESGRIRNLVGKLTTRAGERRTVVFNGERILIGDVPHMMSVTRDVTDQYMAERALAKSERLFRSLFDAALDSIAILSPEGAIVDANPAACRASGYALVELVGRPVNDLLDQHDPAGPLGVTEVFERGSVLAERRMLGKDGRSVPVEAHAWGLPDGNIQLIMRDLTESKRSEALVRELNVSLERRVAERTAELEAANRELESFSQMISHDLRAPVRAISGFTEALRRSHASGLDEKGARYLELVDKNATRMDTMIGDLLKLAQAGRAQVAKVPVDMRALAASVVEELTGPAPGRAEVIVGDLPPVSGDSSLLRQVWVNLISNALKFSSKIEHPRIEVGAERRRGEVEFFVRDNGCGFEFEYAHKLFGMFQRLHSEREFEGTGVGLAIIHRIVERHGGRVSAHSAQGEGATFRFSLPA